MWGKITTAILGLISIVIALMISISLDMQSATKRIPNAYAQATGPAITPQPTHTFIPTPYVTVMPTSTPDPGGLGGSCDEATRVHLDDFLQEDQFEVPLDVDWFTFDIVEGIPYRIDVEIPIGSSADVNLELYPDCNQGPTTTWVESFAPGIQIDFTPQVTGPVYLRLTNTDDSIGGDYLRYQLLIRELNQETRTGAVITVAGRLKTNDSLQDNIYSVTDEVFTIFQGQGYTKDDIYYLAPETEGLLDYDAAATTENLRWAITQWAADRLRSTNVPDVLTLFMMDHGDVDVLYLDKPRGQELTPDQLDGWLDALELSIPGIKINVIIEACHAGSFIQEPNSISAPNRVIVTSSDQENDAYASADGAYFSDQFLTALREGHDLFKSWQGAKDVVENLFVVFPQRPWLDGDGDGKHNEQADFAAASRRGFSYAGTLDGLSDDKLWPPYIAQATPPEKFDGNRGLISAEVRDDRGVSHVWAIIYPPSYVPLTQDNELVDEQLQTIRLNNVGDNLYQGNAYDFSETGSYRIIIHADDADGLVAQPVVVEFFNQQNSLGKGLVYLPFISQ